MKLKNLINEANKPGQIEEDFITGDDVIALKKKLLGYSVAYDSMSGTLEWYKKGQEENLYATPSWDGNWGIVPFDDDDGNHYGELDFTGKKYFQNHKLQMATYLKTVKNILQKIDKRAKESSHDAW